MKKLDEQEFGEEEVNDNADKGENKEINEDMKTFGDDEGQKEEKAEAPAASEENNEEDEKAEARKLFGFDK